jgi:hypothetical protein
LEKRGVHGSAASDTMNGNYARRKVDAVIDGAFRGFGNFGVRLGVRDQGSGVRRQTKRRLCNEMITHLTEIA